MKQIGSILDEQNWLETMELACKRSIDANPEKEGDFMKDGFLHCGKCKEPKREYFEWHGHQILTSRDCKCIRDEKERIEKQKRYEEKMARIARLRSVSLMDEVFYKATFKNFDITDDNRKIYNACAKYCRAFQQMLEDNQVLLFYGNVIRLILSFRMWTSLLRRLTMITTLTIYLMRDLPKTLMTIMTIYRFRR